MSHRDKSTVPFTNPFRYSPSDEVRKAASHITSYIDGLESLSKDFGEGKMLGVLIADSGEDGSRISIAAFSGNAGGCNVIDGFVPPVFDLLEPSGHFKRTEAGISRINEEISAIENSAIYKEAKDDMERTTAGWERKIKEYRAFMADEKQKRERIRSTSSDNGTLSALIRESQFQKAQSRRMKAMAAAEIKEAEQRFSQIREAAECLRDKRQRMSDGLQRWIFQNFIVRNARGEERSIYDIFADKGLVPPAGTGECAAPKLLQYAYTHNLRPVAMGEFWYCSPKGTDRKPDEANDVGEKESGQRIRGMFYPSCKSKCGPLLEYMLQGLDIEKSFEPAQELPEILWEDEVMAVVSKPSGMLCVPGKTGGESLQEWLQRHYLTAGIGTGHTVIYSVHRLDMDTSGIVVFAKTPQAQRELQRQFASREVQKTYIAVVENRIRLKAGEEGVINLPLSADFDNRPAQKVDMQNGRPSLTGYRVIGFSETADLEDCSGCLSDTGRFAVVEFRPETGRTHQLRVHSASGLGCPIAGDRIYGGGNQAERLCLHAESIRLSHPITGNTLEFTKKAHFKRYSADVTKR